MTPSSVLSAMLAPVPSLLPHPLCLLMPFGPWPKHTADPSTVKRQYRDEEGRETYKQTCRIREGGTHTDERESPKDTERETVKSSMCLYLY